MLAISSSEYYAPRKIIQKDGKVAWCLYSARGGSYLVAYSFTYTILNHPIDESDRRERLSFIYDGASVKPHNRTLRIFGADKCARYTRVLANNVEKTGHVCVIEDFRISIEPMIN